MSFDRGYGIICMAIVFLLVHGCSDDKKEKIDTYESVTEYSNNYNNLNSYSSEEECIEPENPYDEYSEEGHYAGFERAERTGGYCDGNSNSFNEGCEEYYIQEEDYENCIDNQ